MAHAARSFVTQGPSLGALLQPTDIDSDREASRDALTRSTPLGGTAAWAWRVDRRAAPLVLTRRSTTSQVKSWRAQLASDRSTAAGRVPPCRLPVHPREGHAAPQQPGASRPAIDASGSDDSSASSSLQREALLRLLGPSSAATGVSLLAQAHDTLRNWLQPGDLEAPGPALYSSQSHDAGDAMSMRESLPAPQLRMACLASVAAALVCLPQANMEGLPLALLQAWGGQGPAQRSGGEQGGWAASVRARSALAVRLPSSEVGAGVAAAAAVAKASRGRLSAPTAPGAGAVAAGAVAVTAVAAAAGAEAAGALGGGGGGSTAAAPGPEVAGPKVPGGKSGAEAAGGAEAKEASKEAVRPALLENPLRYLQLLFAGAMSAVVSRTCVAPLERVKMDLMLKNNTGGAAATALQVLRTEGIAGFWKGNALNVLRTAPFKAVNFFSFDTYHAALMALTGRDGNTERFAAGACAGVTATLICFPLDLVRTRLLASVAGPRYGAGPFATLRGIVRHEGFGALYSGCLPAVIGMTPAGAVFYGVYDSLKHAHVEHERARAVREGRPPPAAMDPLHTLLYGAAAGAASELIVYPLEVVRRKMQLQSMALAGLRQASSHHMGGHVAAGAAASGGGARLAAAAAAAATSAHHFVPPHCVLTQQALAALASPAIANSPGLARVAAAVTAILRADGMGGFYRGMLPNMLQVLPSAALSYYTYDTIKTMLGAT